MENNVEENGLPEPCLNDKGEWVVGVHRTEAQEAEREKVLKELRNLAAKGKNVNELISALEGSEKAPLWFLSLY